MTLEIVIPESDANEKTTKDLVFSILIEDRPKTLTQLHREIKQKYRVSVSFQAVIKAVNSLLSYGVLIKDEKAYSIDKEWIFKTRNFFDRLYTEYFKVQKPLKKVELGKEVIVYTVHNLLELDRLWNDLLTNWAKEEKEDKRNCWRGRHAWWIMPRLQEEDILHDFMIKQGIKTYNLWTENTPLDKIASNYYKKKEEFSRINTRLKVDGDYHIAAFGDNILKFEIPKELSKELDKIYKKTRNLEDLDIKGAIDLFKENVEIEVTLIKDEFLANKVKEEIVGYFEQSEGKKRGLT